MWFWVDHVYGSFGLDSKSLNPATAAYHKISSFKQILVHRHPMLHQFDKEVKVNAEALKQDVAKE